MEKDMLILGEGQFYSMDCYETQLNNNVLVVGTSGAGKTRSIVTPNLLQASGSYILSDPKGNLYRKYKPYLEEQGYEVKKLDFTDPMHSAHYNFFHYIQSTQDIVKVAHMLTYRKESARSSADPFWDKADQLLMQAIIAYQLEFGDNTKRGREENFANTMKIIGHFQGKGDLDSSETLLDILMEKAKIKNPDSYAVKTYQKFRIAADKTLRSILITAYANLGIYDTPEIAEMTKKDDIDIASIGRKKTALFVVVSDTDRSMDSLVNIFFTQAMNELCRVADHECEDNRLPIPVRFILDDFATNCRIDEFPRMIASIRSRGISTMLMIQAESQLTESYGWDGRTIIGNCDTYVYLGGNDIETAEAIAKRCDLPMKKILYMPVGTNWIFRRGQAPVNAKNFELDPFLAGKRLKPVEAQIESGGL